ncbi:MAG: hypothetical protein ACRDXE_10495 [Acidimicrobiales bacterium]
MPVKSKPWAVVSTVLFAISRASGYRVLNGAKGRAHRRAGGLRGR